MITQKIKGNNRNTTGEIVKDMATNINKTSNNEQRFRAKGKIEIKEPANILGSLMKPLARGRFD
jgi:hypothetical protein